MLKEEQVDNDEIKTYLTSEGYTLVVEKEIPLYSFKLVPLSEKILELDN